MKRNSLHIVHSGKYTLPVGIVLFLLLLLANALLYTGGHPENIAGLFCNPVNRWVRSPVASFLLYQGLLVTEAFLLVRLCDIYSLLYSRTPLIFLMYILLGNFNPRFAGQFDAAILIALLFMIALFGLFGSYQQEKSQSNAFLTGLLLAAGTLCWPLFLYFLPVFWWGYYLMRSLNLRTVLASLLGVVTPLWLIYTFRLVWNFPLCTEQWLQTLSSLPLVHHRIGVEPDFLYTLPTVFFGLVTVALNLFNDYQDKIRTLASSRFFYLVTFAAVFMIFTGTAIEESVALLNICITYQGARYFVHARNRVPVYFLCFMGIVYTLSYVWILLQD